LSNIYLIHNIFKVNYLFYLEVNTLFMPVPNQGESKEDFVKRFMSSKEAKKDYPDEKQRLAVAYQFWKKHSKQKADLIIEFSVPITEFGETQVKEGFNDFKIKGVAINETITSNGHKFIGEELSLAANTLKGVPLLKDHDNSVDSIVGRVLDAGYNVDAKNIVFEAKVMDSKVREMIADGRLNSVSVGAQVKELEESEGFLIPRGITFKELSVVAVPADSMATFQVALMEAYKKTKEEPDEEQEMPKDEAISQSNKSENTLKGGLNMTEEKQAEVVAKEEIKVVEKIVEKQVDNAELIKLKSELDAMKKLIEAQKAETEDKAKAELTEDAKFTLVSSHEGLGGNAISVVMKKY